MIFLILPEDPIPLLQLVFTHDNNEDQECGDQPIDDEIKSQHRFAESSTLQYKEEKYYLYCLVSVLWKGNKLRKVVT